MKKLLVCLMASVMLFAFNPIQLKAVDETAPVVATVTVTSTRIDELNQRLVEINEMDMSSLKSSEKRVLRKEVRSINTEMKSLGGGVYISAGAAIIIIILLIILL
jgi:hypothetical protein